MNAADRAYWVGVRVQLHPGTDAWTAADRYGLVVKAGRRWLHVRMDRSGRTVKVPPGRVFIV